MIRWTHTLVISHSALWHAVEQYPTLFLFHLLLLLCICRYFRHFSTDSQNFIAVCQTFLPLSDRQSKMVKEGLISKITEKEWKSTFAKISADICTPSIVVSWSVELLLIGCSCFSCQDCSWARNNRAFLTRQKGMIFKNFGDAQGENNFLGGGITFSISPSEEI